MKVIEHLKLHYNSIYNNKEVFVKSQNKWYINITEDFFYMNEYDNSDYILNLAKKRIY